MEVDYRVIGDGPPLLLLHGAAEDAELLAPQANAFVAQGYRVITYDRRGTGRSTRAGWPDGGVALHVADAAALIAEVAGAPATVLGFSSGGVLALAVAEEHPELVSEAIAWEPPALAVLPDGHALHAQLVAPMKEYLSAHPTDWDGAFDVLTMTMSGGTADLRAPAVQRMRRNAEPALRDDGPIITAHPLHPRPGAAAVVIATGAGHDPLLRQIAAALAAAFGTDVWSVPGADNHEVYLSAPDVLATAFGARALA